MMKVIGQRKFEFFSEIELDQAVFLRSKCYAKKTIEVDWKKNIKEYNHIMIGQ